MNDGKRYVNVRLEDSQRTNSHKKHGPSLAHRAVRSALWQLMGGGWQTFVRLGASVFLARALRPEDFGIFGMAILIRNFLLAIGNLGMGAGLISKKEVTQTDLSTCYWSLVSVRILLFLLCYLGAPIAGFFWDNMCVVPVVRAVSFLFLISILDAVSLTLLVKELKFGKLNVIRGVSTLFESILAVYLAAFIGLGYWSLVYAMLAASAMTSISIFWVAGWKPSMDFNRESFRYLFHFGINIFGYSVTKYLNENVDYLLVGRILGAHALGLYEFAYRIPHLIFERISSPIGAVTFPALAKINQDDEHLVNGYLTATRCISFITFPLLLGLAGVAEVGVSVLWGKQWTPIVTPLRILALHAALACAVQPIRSIFLCKERPELQFWLQTATLVATTICVAAGGYLFGLNGVAIGMLSGGILLIISVWFGLKLVHGKIFNFIKAIAPAGICSIACGVVASFIVQVLLGLGWNEVTVLSMAILGGGAVYIFSCFVFMPETTNLLLNYFKLSILR